MATERSGVSGIVLRSGPFAILIVAMIYVIAHWDAVPERFPIHWDLTGRANGWASRSMVGVFAPTMVSGAICLAMVWTSRLITRTARVPPDHVALRLANLMLLAISYLASIICAGATIALPLSQVGSLAGLLALAIAGVLLTLTIFLVAARRALRADRSAGGLTTDDGWKWGLIYANPADPALWVPKRVGFGWTINTGHPWGWPMLIVVFGGSLLLIAAVTIAVSRPR